MSRREAWLSAAAVFVVALAVRIVAARAIGYPVPEDTAYYVDASANLVHGRGFVVDALWSYQTPPLVLPRPAFEVWLPLPSLLAALPIAILGDDFRAAQVASVVVGSLVPVLAWRLGADVAAELRLPPGRARTLAVGSGLVTAVVAVAVVYSALPDSTAPFAVLTLTACLLMTRLVATLRSAETAATDDTPDVAGRYRTLGRPLGLSVTLGIVLGAAALCRSEVVWLGATWLAVAWFAVPGSLATRLRVFLVPSLVAGVVFLPWVVRDWIVFGQPMPGQTIANALSIRPTDIYAYRDQPTLARYLAEGPGTLAAMRVTGTLHNLVNVLVLPAIPTGLLGLIALPRLRRIETLRPLLVSSLLAFLAASLVFPVATTWGTFLHGSLAIDVLLVVSTLLALDALIVRVGRFRGWTRPVAWLGPALAIAVALPLTNVSISQLSGSAADAANRYRALPAALSAAGVAVEGPVITDHPIWFTYSTGLPAIALPDESPADVLQLARDFGAHLVVVDDGSATRWPGALAEGGSASRCFTEVALFSVAADTSTEASEPAAAARSPLAQSRVFRVGCT